MSRHRVLTPPQRIPALGGRVRRGLGLSLLNTVVSRGAMFALGVVLARILSPEQFGVYATALVVQLLLLHLNEFGVGAALVRRPGPIDTLLPTAWTLSVAGGVLVCAAAVAGAPLLATALGSPQAAPLIQVMSLNILVNGFASVPAAVLSREIQQGRRLVADFLGVLTNVGVTAALALSGAGPWSLAFGNVTGAVVVVVALMVLAGVAPRFGFARAHAADIARVGSTMMISAVLLVLLQSAPQAVTGTLLGATAIGLFYIANNVANWPISVVSATLERVVLSSFARVREAGADLGAAASSVLALVGGSVAISAVGLALLAGPLLGTVYGAAWLPAASMLAGLALANVARVVAELVFSLLVAADSVLASLLPQLAWLAVLVPASVLGARGWGFEGVGWAQALVGFGWALPVHLWFARRAGVRVARLLGGLGTPLCIAAGLAGALVALRLTIPSPVVTLAVGIPLTGASVLLAILLLRGRLATAMAAA